MAKFKQGDKVRIKARLIDDAELGILDPNAIYTVAVKSEWDFPPVALEGIPLTFAPDQLAKVSKKDNEIATLKEVLNVTEKALGGARSMLKQEREQNAKAAEDRIIDQIRKGSIPIDWLRSTSSNEIQYIVPNMTSFDASDAGVKLKIIAYNDSATRILEALLEELTR